MREPVAVLGLMERTSPSFLFSLLEERVTAAVILAWQSPEDWTLPAGTGGGGKELCLMVSVLLELCFKQCLEQFREFQVEKSVFFVVGRIMLPTKSTS